MFGLRLAGTASPLVQEYSWTLGLSLAGSAHPARAAASRQAKDASVWLATNGRSARKESWTINQPAAAERTTTVSDIYGGHLTGAGGRREGKGAAAGEIRSGIVHSFIRRDVFESARQEIDSL